LPQPPDREDEKRDDKEKKENIAGSFEGFGS